MISDIEVIIEKFKKGEMVILVDDEDRENEGDLIVSSQYLTPEHINFMITYAKGLVCAPIAKDVATKLKLSLMQGIDNEEDTQFTTSVDLMGDGVSTGISADDRFKTIKGLSDPNATRQDFKVPGHVFPLQAMDGGVLRRAGHTEAAVDLCLLADHYPVRLVGSEMCIRDRTYENYLEGESSMVRVHSECLTGDVFSSNKCDCGYQLDSALETIVNNGSGVLLYMRGHEGRGIGLGNKIKAYSLQDEGADTVEANIQLGFEMDQRDYGTGALILRDLGITNMNLLTNNPSKRAGLEGFGLNIVKRTPIKGKTTPENTSYLETKENKMGHNFNEE